MSTLKCKMCGGTLQYEEGKTVVECEYCGSINTLPNIGDEKRLQMFDRANRLRSNCDFERASGVYESIVAEYPEEAEAYWGLVLCKYGIEYVDDPATGKKVPTCHRSSFDSLFDDDNFDQVMENCDQYSRDVYREEAKQIEEIRKGIVEISSKADPYDIFICYKETDDNGDRTVDSLIAQDIYDVLVAKDYKVFFARITLEDKLGQEYEPYIFAALNSAKVMLVVGTNYGNFNAVWVKNEWTRYLKLMEKDKTKYLVPCYRDIDAYDMPKEFSKLQAQDMSKVGAIQDLVRGVEKMIPRGSAQSVVQSGGADVIALTKRMNQLLSEKEWQKAEMIAENIIASDPDNASAYIGKLMAEMRVSEESDLVKCSTPLDKSKNYDKVIKIADESTKQRISQYNEQIKSRNSKKSKTTVVAVTAIIVVAAFVIALFLFIIPTVKYNSALALYNAKKYEEAYEAFKDMNYKDSSEQAEKCLVAIQNVKYDSAMELYNAQRYEEAYEALKELNYKDSSDIAHDCLVAIQKAGLSDIAVGSTIRIGFYDQDNDPANGDEEIVWRVLAIEGNEAMLISEDVLCFQTYKNKAKVADWERSELRNWLNNDFYNEAFSDGFTAYIVDSIVTADNNPIYDTAPGGDTTDKLYILSVVDVDRYFSSDEERLCQYNGQNCSWWLRSPGYNAKCAAYVDENGSIRYDGSSVSSSLGVRPVMWIKLDN